ncbi:MAG TPA: single-stranded-DNA-specific exonuclease RecJ [Solirubrobacteraceae bacterium]|jgi:single-stranded-DNA-specific exonuclease|nr:single-stranded-DNA-specific exonuclease RecJ [Solirubrobacteraceae bacterium]
MIRFETADCDPASVACLRDELGVSDVLAQVLVRRGYADPRRARAFLAADEDHELDRFPGLGDAAELILAAVHARRRITIHGDYDVDGVCSTAVLVRGLRALGADVDWYLPDRSEGYGLSEATVRLLAQRGTGLLVTVDCGITAVQEVALARSLGMDAIVSDHHLPRADGELPDAAIVHPLLCGYPCSDLCAAAVAHKLARATLLAAGHDQRHPEEDLDLVALATIADVVPLLGENRSIVRRGLRALAATTKPGLRALMAVARIEPGKLNERAVGFGLAPRINAAGRLYHADAALELILTEDRPRAAQIAQELDRANSERRQTELAIRLQAEAQIASLDRAENRSAYVLAGEDWHRGVTGIVASRLVERYRRPVVLVSLEGDSARGSGRSIDRYDLLAGLTACDEHLVRYGGHSAAAGVELQREQIESFAAALDTHAAQALCADDLLERERVDALVDGRQLGMGLAEELARLAPFGKGNPTVSLMLSGASLRDVRPMGEGKHARFTIESDGVHARAVAFGNDGKLGVAEGEPVDATFVLEVNEWRGVSEPRLVLRHVQTARAQPPQIGPPEVAPVVEALERAQTLERPTDPPAPIASPVVGELVLF